MTGQTKNRKVFLISMPRHGTNSTEHYLKANGFSLAHNGRLLTGNEEGDKRVWGENSIVRMHQQISNGDFNLDILQRKDCQGLAVYPASSHYRQLAMQYQDSLFIHITRDKAKWLDSAERHLTRVQNIIKRTGSRKLQEAFAFFREAQFGTNDFYKETNDRTKLSLAYDKHYAKVKEFTHDLGKDRILSLPLEKLAKKQDAVDELNKFVDIKDSKIKFPFKNDHSAYYQGLEKSLLSRFRKKRMLSINFPKVLTS